MIKLNLNETYEIVDATDDLSNFVFFSVLSDGSKIPLQVNITPHPDIYLPYVFNLAFRPSDDSGEIDDQIQLHHQSVSKLFSTILLIAITFLRNNDGVLSIGIDGSNDARASLYHRIFRYNQKELSDLITLVGVDWYVRLLRNRDDIERDDEGFPLFKPRPEPFDTQRKTNDLYRYYMFRLNS